MSDISGLISSFQALYSLAKSMLDIREFEHLNAKVIEMQQIIVLAQNQTLAAQESLSAQSTKIRQLEEECMRLKDWSAESQRYSHREIAPGVFAHVENVFVGNFQHAHKLCSHCFYQHERSPVQESAEEHRRISLSCFRCKGKIKFLEGSYYDAEPRD